jgi:hypothetical protein
VLHSLFALELCVRTSSGAELAPALAALVRSQPERPSRQDAWGLHRRACDLLIAALPDAERGCWDYYDDDERARREYDDWAGGMLTEAAARTEPSVADPYRSPGGPTYVLFTMAFLLAQGTATHRALRDACDVPEPAYWLRSTFEHLLRAVPAVDFAGVQSDVVYVVPADARWALTAEDLAEPRFDYLRPLA